MGRSALRCCKENGLAILVLYSRLHRVLCRLIVLRAGSRTIARPQARRRRQHVAVFGRTARLAVLYREGSGTAHLAVITAYD